jgi:hypothetical protein
MPTPVGLGNPMIAASKERSLFHSSRSSLFAISVPLWHLLENDTMNDFVHTCSRRRTTQRVTSTGSPPLSPASTIAIARFNDGARLYNTATAAHGVAVFSRKKNILATNVNCIGKSPPRTAGTMARTHMGNVDRSIA